MNLPVLIFLFPFVSAIIMPAVGLARRNLCQILSVTALGGMSVLAWFGLLHVLRHGPIHYTFGGWTPPLGIEWVMDPLSSIIVFLIAIISLVVSIHSIPGIKKQFKSSSIPFFILTLLLVSGLAGMTFAGDLFNLFVFLEVASLSGYALVASGEGRALLAAFRYLLMGTVGTSFYLLGVGFLYAVTGTLNMSDLAVRLPLLFQSKAAILGMVFIVTGLAVKMGLFPMHGWLPDSYTYAPDSVSAIMAPIVTKIPVYALIRILFWATGAGSGSDKWQLVNYLGWLGVFGAIGGSMLAFKQINFKKMLAYSSISQIGLIVIGVSIGNSAALCGSILHIINHAFMKSCLFVIAGTVFYSRGIKNILEFARLRHEMPLTLTALVITAISMIGIPPTCGFFSKWYLIAGAFEAKKYVFGSAVIVSSFFTAAYFFRVLEKTFFGSATASANMEHGIASKTGELPFPMLFGVSFFAAVVVILGLFSGRIVSFFVRPALPF